MCIHEGAQSFAMDTEFATMRGRDATVKIILLDQIAASGGNGLAWTYMRVGVCLCAHIHLFDLQHCHLMEDTAHCLPALL